MKRSISNALQSLKGPFLVAFVLALAWPARAQYKQTNLVSDLVTVGAAVTDPLLVNPWGVSHSPTSPFWISDAGVRVATLYSVDGTTGTVAKVGLTVHMPVVPPGISSGLVFNGSSDFVVSQGSASGPAVFIFAGLDGNIYGWNPQVPLPVPPSTISDVATLAATGTPPAVHTGLAIGLLNGAQQLYAANPAGNHIDVYDNTFANVNASFAGKWLDPALPSGLAPFNIANINGQLFVSYTPANPATAGAGVINVFDTAGNFLKRFATGGTLLSPWGMVVAPSNFGSLSNALLVGNFNLGNSANGPGYISAFDLGTGAFLGLLKGTDGTPVQIDGLWQLIFGNGGEGGSPDVLYFSAGIQNQMHGLFGSLSVACHGPVIAGASANPNVLWPPNHQTVPVTVSYTVTDDCDPDPVSSLSVSSNEGEGGGSGNTFPDWIVVDAHNVDLVAERMGTGNGRVYTITVTSTDKAGLTASATMTVTVPLDLGQN